MKDVSNDGDSTKGSGAESRSRNAADLIAEISDEFKEELGNLERERNSLLGRYGQELEQARMEEIRKELKN